MTGIGMELLVPLFVGIAASLMAAITFRILKDYGFGTLISIAVIFFIIGVVVARLIFPIPALVEVPNIVGYSEDDAEKIIKEKDLIFNVIDRIHSDTVQKYKVISQDPPPGLRVNADSVTNVVVSIGPQTTSTQNPTPTVTYATPKPIVKLWKINNTRIGISIFNPMVRPADPHKNPAAVSVVAKVEVNNRTGVTMSSDGLIHCNLDLGTKFEKQISMECDESYEVWVEYTYIFQDEDELRSSRTASLIMPAKPNSIPNLPAWIGVFIILMVFTIKKMRH